MEVLPVLPNGSSSPGSRVIPFELVEAVRFLPALCSYKIPEKILHPGVVHLFHIPFGP